MKGFTQFYLSRSIWLAALLLWAIALPGQGTQFVKITPEKVTLLIGESKTFRLVDQNGQRQNNVSWNISDPDAFQAAEGDELTITAKRAGDFTVSAHNPDGSAEATIKVLEGSILPQGTAKWSGASVEGCKTTKVIPAVPSANGPDIFEQSKCEDGEYLAAYTSEGIQLWRRKLGGAGPPPAAEFRKNGAAASPPNTGRLDLRSPSICDLVVIGTDQQKIREVLNQRNLSFSEGTRDERAWIVDESSTQCKLWFDEKSVLTKKRKMFVSQ
jgi:hypothetical protein